jgi:hypothetical protein
VPIGKACSGYIDAELGWLDRWIRNHTTGRFGPVREVEKALVLEVNFDAAQRSTRHKFGVALRFPRIARIRTDKPASEADRLDNLLSFIEARAPTGTEEADAAEKLRRTTPPPWCFAAAHVPPLRQEKGALAMGRRSPQPHVARHSR